MTFKLWPHQTRAVNEVLAHMRAGVRRILLTSPTGGGKSLMVAELIRQVREKEPERGNCVLYTNRKLLVEQLTRSLQGYGIQCGVRAAGAADNRDLPVQVSSIQTEDSRVYKRKGHLKWELHPANVVFVDEAHIQTGAVARRIMGDHLKAGAVVVLVTATPLDMEGLADVIVRAGVTSELRECGALVLARHYGPDEPDLRHVGRTELTMCNDLSEEKQRSLMGAVGEDGQPTMKLQKLFGRVFDWYDRLNPERKPGILFAPGVPESRWFAQQFTDRGVPAAHIDGDEIWVSGATIKSDRVSRDELLGMSKDGTVKLICNRFVLREGIDCPWLSHGIFATPFGSLQSYLQSGGRMLRNHVSLDHVTIQDHGGNWWRHGSLNADREWNLDCTSRIIQGTREDRLREKKLPEPMRCPRCGAIMMSVRCVCGFTMHANTKTRPVVQEDGTLIMMEGDIFRPRKTELRADTGSKWLRVYNRAKNADMTFKAAVGLFFKEFGYFPPNNLPMMPKNADDVWRKVKDVKPERLL